MPSIFLHFPIKSPPISVEIVRVTLALKALTKRPTSKLLMTVQDLAHFHNSLERLLGLHQPAKVTYNLKVRRAWKVYFAFLMHIQDVPNMNTRGYKKIVVRALSEYAIFLNINMHTRTITVHETIELFRNKVKDWFRHPFLVSKVVVRSRFDNEAVMR